MCQKSIRICNRQILTLSVLHGASNGNCYRKAGRIKGLDRHTEVLKTGPADESVLASDPHLQKPRRARSTARARRHGSMTGYATTGVGVSGLPVRFNTRAEAVLITLRRT